MSIICCDFKVLLILILVYLNKVILKIYVYIYIFVFNILYIELCVCFFLSIYFNCWLDWGRKGFWIYVFGWYFDCDLKN